MDNSLDAKLGDYANRLEEKVKDRYKKKISCIGIDPFIIPESTLDTECLPPVESIDLVSYLVCETSHYTQDQFKAWRSLQAYNHMVSGFINSVQGIGIAEKFVVLGKVRHSQKMSDPLVQLWIITENNGTINSAHCRGCMAGQGECCSHIASVLFYLETFNRLRGKLSCTEMKCAWIMPTFVKDVPYLEVEDIDFRSAKKLKQELDAKIETLGSQTAEATDQPEKNTSVAEAPNEYEMKEFYAKLHACKTKPVALSLIPPYSQSFVSKSRNIKTISSLYDKKYLDIEYHELLDACSTVDFEMTEDELITIEEDTRSQAQSINFFRHRAGRIGASISKQASHSDPANPPYH